MLDLFADRPFVFENVHRSSRFVDAFQDLVDGVDEIENRDIRPYGWAVAFEFELAGIRAKTSA